MKAPVLLRASAVLLAASVTVTVGLLAAAFWLWWPNEPNNQASVAVIVGQQADAQQSAAPKVTHRLSGPFTHDNLIIFLIHGQDQFQVKDLLTLPEALEQKKAVIHETQSVNELSVENLSPSEEVLILSGDILKGGQQDRFAQFDLIVPPKSGKVALQVFCVEHTAARWMRPLQGEDKKFGISPGLVATNSLRLAGRLYKDQRAVWDKVTKVQMQLSENAGKSVKAADSDSSLALSLQAKEVREATDRYIAKLSPIVKDQKDAIGYAFAINGKVICADVYGANALFVKVWPRLLEASTTEAFANLEKGKKFEPVTAAAVQTFMAEAEKGKVSSTQDVGKGIRQITRDAKGCVLFESQQEKSKGAIRSSALGTDW